MNIVLKYDKSIISFDVVKNKPISYIKDIASKVFNLDKDSIILNYSGQQIMKTDLLLKDYFLNVTKATFIIEGAVSSFGLSNSELKSSHLSNYKTKQNTSAYSKEVSLGFSSDTQNSASIQCRQCFSKELMHYCRQCHIFMCENCKSKNASHNEHKLLFIQNGNAYQTSFVYKKHLIDEIKQMQKDFNESKNELPDSVIKSEIQDFVYNAESIISKKDDMCLKFVPSTINIELLESLVNKIFSVSSIEKEANENVEGIYRQLQANEKEIEALREDIAFYKIKNDLKSTVYSIVKQMNLTLEKSLNDLDSIYQKAMHNKLTLIGNVKEFINKYRNCNIDLPTNPSSGPTETNAIENNPFRYNANTPVKPSCSYSPMKNQEKNNLVRNYLKFNPKTFQDNNSNDQNKCLSSITFPKIEMNSRTVEEISEGNFIRNKINSKAKVSLDSFHQRRSMNDLPNYKAYKTGYGPINESKNSLFSDHHDSSSYDDSDQFEPDYFKRREQRNLVNHRQIGLQKNRAKSDMNIPLFNNIIQSARRYIPIDPYKSLLSNKKIKRIKCYVNNII